MLTKTQLQTAKTKKLERLQARIQAELDARREEERDKAAEECHRYEGAFGYPSK